MSEQQGGIRFRIAQSHAASAEMRLDPKLPWPAWWKWTVIALSTLVLCSCRATEPALRTSSPAAPMPLPQPSAQMGLMPLPAALPPGLPHGASNTAAPAPSPAIQLVSAQAPLPLDPGGTVAASPPMRAPHYGPPPYPEAAYLPWAPPAISRPWPRDEYLRDGGDREAVATVSPDWFIKGLETEDTIAHYDTLDGQTHVEPSNPVCIYAPRFSAVRSVVSLVEEQQVEVTRGLELPQRIARHDMLQVAASSKQQEQAIPQEHLNGPHIFRQKLTDGAISNALLPGMFADRYLPFEDFLIIKKGIFDQTEKPLLAQAVDAAIVWSGDQAVQVILDKQRATEAVADRKAAAVYIVDDSRGPAKLRVCKVASERTAKPGEIIDFTLRFDNVGDQLIGNVTLIDNLTNRLEYVPDSAQSSLKSNFSTQSNDGGSLALRWEIEDPLSPGQGGIIRFRCKVR